MHESSITCLSQIAGSFLQIILVYLLTACHVCISLVLGKIMQTQFSHLVNIELGCRALLVGVRDKPPHQHGLEFPLKGYCGGYDFNECHEEVTCS